MRTVLLCAVIGSILVASAGDRVMAGVELPKVDGRTAVASVNGEMIFLDDLLQELSAIHEGAGEGKPVARPDLSSLLSRMIDTRLIVQEARTMGLDGLPEVQRAFEAYERNTLRAMLFGRHVLSIRISDNKEVDRRYREAVKEVRVASVLFEKEGDAKKLEAGIRASGDFRELAKRMIDDGVAKGNAEGEYLKFSNLLPQVATALSTMKTGQVTPILKIKETYSMVKLLGVRYPEDPEARRKAEEEVLEAKRTAALKAYVEGLKKKYVRIDEKLMKELDFDSPKPGFETLMKDTRTVAEVKGEKPVTVKELAEALQKRFFHGVEGAAQRERINRKKGEVLEGILFQRVTDKEARRLKIDRTPEYKKKIEENRRRVLFGVFVQKVIRPDIRLTDLELKTYWNEHIAEYTTPEMMRIESIAFSERKYAEKAAENLRRGSDFQWTRANAEGRVDKSKEKDLLFFGKGPVMTDAFPEGLRKAVAGAVGGEYRLYSPSGGPFYVLYVQEVVPPAPQPFESVREQIARQVFARKLHDALEEYVKKLRAASDVKTFASTNELQQIVRE